MRRTLVAVVAVAAVLSTAVSAGAAPARERPFEGTGTGSGTFTLYPSCGIASSSSSGTFEASLLKRGTYTLDLCMALDYTFQARFVFTDRKGEELEATFAGPTAVFPIPMQVTGGTGRFAGATGSLVLRTSEYDKTNCNPKIGICFNWDEEVTVTGNLALHHGRHRVGGATRPRPHRPAAPRGGSAGGSPRGVAPAI